MSGRRRVDQGVDTVIKARYGHSLELGGEKCLDYGYILEAEAVKFGDDLDVGMRERKVNYDTKVFVLSNWKTKVASSLKQ